MYGVYDYGIVTDGQTYGQTDGRVDGLADGRADGQAETPTLRQVAP